MPEPEMFVVRSVDERPFEDSITLTLDDGNMIMLTVEDYAESKMAVAEATGIPVADVTLVGMALTYGEGGVPVPPAG